MPLTRADQAQREVTRLKNKSTSDTPLFDAVRKVYWSLVTEAGKCGSPRTSKEARNAIAEIVASNGGKLRQESDVQDAHAEADTFLRTYKYPDLLRIQKKRK